MLRTLLIASVLLAINADAQERPALQILLPGTTAFEQAAAEGDASSRSPMVSSRDVLASGQIRGLVSNGFPARLHYKLEQWAVGRLFDNLRRTVEWDVVVRFDPLTKHFQVFRVTGPQAALLGDFPDYNAAAATAQAPYLTAMPAPKNGQRTYYSLVLEVESLSLSDLDEVERWLRGELKPAIRGDKNPGTALSRGLGTLFVKLMGGDKRRYETRSGRFTAK